MTALSQNSAFAVNLGATLDLNGFSHTIGSLANGAGGGGTVTNNGASDATLTSGGDNSSTTFSGTIKDGATNKLALTKTGTGTMTLSGNNTYSGTTTVDNGTLRAGSAAGFSQQSAFAVNLNGTLDVNGFNSTIASLSDGAGGGGIVTNRGAANAALTVGNTSSTSFSGSIQDGPTNTLALVKTGAGTLTLSGTNTYSGGTVISAGALQVTNASSVGSGTVTLDGGTFQADGAGDLAFTNNFKVNTTGGAIDNNGVVLTLSGIISNGNGNTGVLQLTDSTGGFGTTVLAGVNTYSGGTKVTSAAVQVTNNSSVGTGTVTL